MVSTRRGALALGGALAVLPWAANAQAYPARAVRIIVPTGAGGITDVRKLRDLADSSNSPAQ